MGKTKERKAALRMSLGIVMMKSLKTLRRMIMLRRWGCSWPCLSWGEGGS